MQPNRVAAHLLLIVGVFACATSVIFIKASTLNAATLSAMRLLIAAALLTPIYISVKRKFAIRSRTSFRHAAPGAALLAVHLISWAAAARMTSSANATLIVNLVPIAMPFILLMTTDERITGREIVGTILSIGGVLVLTIGSSGSGHATRAGDLLCFVSMLLFALYLAVAKHHRAIAARSSVWLYIVPLYWLAGLCSLAVAMTTTPTPWHLASPREWTVLFLLACLPTIVGHSTLNYAMQTLRGQTVSIFNLGQFVFAGALGFLIYREVPDARFYVASALVVVGAMAILISAPKTAPEEVPE